MRFLLPALLLAGSCLLTACDLAGTATTHRPLIGTTWQLVAFEEATGNPSRPVSIRHRFADVAYTVTFTTQPAVDSSYNGPNGAYHTKTVGYPNQGFFTYDHVEDGTLSLFFHGATEINPLPGSVETRFFQALEGVRRYRIKGDRMRLTYGSGRALLFRARATPPIRSALFSRVG
jgi:hypothetical protein